MIFNGWTPKHVAWWIVICATGFGLGLLTGAFLVIVLTNMTV